MREGKSRVGLIREHRKGMEYGRNVGLAVGQAVCLGTRGPDSPCRNRPCQIPFFLEVVIRPQRETKLHQLDAPTWAWEPEG